MGNELVPWVPRALRQDERIMRGPNVIALERLLQGRLRRGAIVAATPVKMTREGAVAVVRLPHRRKVWPVVLLAVTLLAGLAVTIFALWQSGLWVIAVVAAIVSGVIAYRHRRGATVEVQVHVKAKVR